MTLSSPIWPKASAALVARATHAHSVLGLTLGALLYIICLSGSLLIFENEIAWWEEPAAPRLEAMSPEAVEAAARAVAETDSHPTSHLLVYPPTPQHARAIAATDNLAVSVDGEGRIVQERRAPWSGFLVNLHYYLHLPSTFGMIFVSMLGAALLALAISGFFAHPGIFRTAFTMRRDGGRRVAETDLHNRLAVWGAPFHIAIAFTGAWIGLFTLLGVVVAEIGYDGDRGKVVDAVFGWEQPADETPAPLPEIAQAMAYMAEAHPDLVPILILVHEPRTAGQHMQVLAEHPDRLILGEYYNFDAQGRFQGAVGLADGALGQQAAMSIYPVHFGSYGGLAVRIAYALLGLSLCIVIVSGLNIYLIKRSEKGRSAPRLSAMWAAMVWGVPAALAISLLGSVSGVLGETQLAPAFWTILAFAVAGAGVWPRPGRAERLLWFVTSLALCAVLAAYGAVHGGAWSAVPASVAVCVVIAAVAALFLGAVAARASASRERQAQSHS